MMKIRLEQIERGQVLRELIRWYESEQRGTARRFDVLRRRARCAAEHAGFGPTEIERLIHEVRARGVKA